MMSENLVQYVLDAQQGNEDAFAKLYSRTLKNSYYLCLKLTADNAAAEEVLKKSYASAFCSIKKLKRPEAFEAWLKQKIAAALKESYEFTFADVDADVQNTATEFLPTSVLDDDSLCRRIEDYVAYLPIEQRTVAVLYYCVGMPIDFIAKSFSVSPSTVNSLLAKAKQGIVEPLNLGEITLEEGSLPVLTRIFQKSASSTTLSNSLVRNVFIYAIDCLNGDAPSENAVSENNSEPVEDAQETAVSEEPADAADEPEEDDGTVTYVPAAVQEPEKEEATEEMSSLSGDELLKEINQSISDFDNNPAFTAEPVTQDEGIYISRIPDDEPDEPEQPEIPVKEKSKKKSKGGGKSKLLIIVAVILLAALAAGVAALVKHKSGSGSNEPKNPETSSVQASQIKQEWREISDFTKYSKIEYFNETCCLIQDAETGKYGLMSYQGEVKMEPIYYCFKHCSDGRDYDGSANYHYVVQLEAGGDLYTVDMATFEISSVAHQKHLVDSVVFEDKKFSERDRYHNGYAAVKDIETGKWGYISEESGKLVIPCLYETVNDGLDQADYYSIDYCRAVDNGMVAVKKGGKMGVIDLNGDTIVNFEYSTILQGDGGVFIACKNNKWGVVLVGNAVDTYDVAKASVAPITKDLDKILEQYEAIEGQYQANTEINVRSEVGANGDDTIIGTLGFLEKAKAVAKGQDYSGKDWICIEYNGGYGWVRAKYVNEISE